MINSKNYCTEKILYINRQQERANVRKMRWTRTQANMKRQCTDSDTKNR